MSHAGSRHRLEHGLFRLTRRACVHLPGRLAEALGAGAGRATGGLLRVRRRDVDTHLALAFPEQDRRWRAGVALRAYAHLGREAVVLLRAAREGVEGLAARCEVAGDAELRAAAEAGGGALLLTGHLGNWELGGAVLAARGVPLDAVGKRLANPVMQDELERMRSALGVGLLHMEEGPAPILAALRSGRVVAVLADQNAHRSDFFAPFFGRAAATVRGPGLLAGRAGSPVFFGFSTRLRGGPPRYRVRVSRAAFRPTGDAEADVSALTDEYNAALEAAIRAEPSQYFWPHRRWKTRPPEEPGERGAVITATDPRNQMFRS